MPSTIQCVECGRPFSASSFRCPFCNHPRATAAVPPAPPPTPPPVPPPLAGFDFAAAAEQAIAMGRPLLALEFHPAAVVALDAFLEITWGTEGLGPNNDTWSPSEGQRKAILAFGAFFGELMRREFGGHWRPWPDQPGSVLNTTLVLPGGTQVFAVAKVFKRLKNGAADQLEPLYVQARRACAVQGSAAELEGWLRQARHFEGVKRHDLAERFYSRALLLPLAPQARAGVERLRATAAAAGAQHEAEARQARVAGVQSCIAGWAESGRNLLAAQHVRIEGGTATLITAMDVFLDEAAARNRDRVPARELGAFLGELLRTRHGGVWRESEPDAPAERWQVVWRSGALADPFGMMGERLQPGGRKLLQQMAALENTLAQKGDAVIPPEDHHEWMAQADAYAAQPPRLDLALMFASVALQTGGDGPAARLKLARWCLQLGKLPQAKAHLDAALKLDATLPALWLERARVAFLQKDFAPAEADATRCLELDPTEARAHVVRGTSLLARGQGEAALAEMERAAELAPHLAEVLLGKAGALLTLGRARETLEWTTVFAGRSDCEPGRTRFAALAAEQAGEIVQAHELYTRLKDDPRVSQQEREQAAARVRALADTQEVLLAEIEKLELEPAIEAYARLSEKFPELAEPWRERGVGLAMLGRTEQALACLDRAIELDPGTPTAYDHKAVVLGRLRQFDAALTVLERGLRVCPNSGTLWCRRGVFLSMSMHADDALRAFEKSLEVDPGHLEAWAYKGDIEAQQGRTADAIRSLSHLLSLKRGSREKVVAVARRQLWSLQHPEQAIDAEGAAGDHDAALARMQAGDVAGALALVDQALAKNPFAADAWMNRGAFLSHLARTEEALQSYLTAEDVGGPDSLHTRGAAACLEKLGRGTEAVECYDRHLAKVKHPDPQVLREKAQLLTRLGRAAEALPIYERLVVRAPQDAALIRERGDALAAAGRELAARAAHQAAQAPATAGG